MAEQMDECNDIRRLTLSVKKCSDETGYAAATVPFESTFTKLAIDKRTCATIKQSLDRW
jgi:hypothetical protein